MKSDVERVDTEGPHGSLYDVYSPLRRQMVIFTAAIGHLLGYCAIIYLPALKSVEDDLRVGQELVAATVSVYLVTYGLAALVWGPASDRFGRMPVYAVACASYIGSCMGCMFAPNIQVLLVFRALQGSVVAAFTATATGVLADAVPPLDRGKATGCTLVAVGVGVVVSPLVGGGLSRAFGWRSTFAAVAILCALLALGLVVFVRRETHQYYVCQRLARSDSAAATKIAEWDSIMANPPKFVAPWVPLKYIFEPALLPHTLVTIVTWGAVLCITMEALPTALAKAPYDLSAELVGVCLLIDGVPTIIASPLGGFVSDRYAAACPDLMVARLVPNTLVVLVVGPAAITGAAWGLQHHVHVAALLTAVGAACFAAYFYIPAMLSYFTIVKQAAPAAASCGIVSIMTLMSGLVVMAGAVVRRAMGYGWWLTWLGIIQFVVTLVAYILILRKQRAFNAASDNLPPCIDNTDSSNSGDIDAVVVM